MKKLLVLLLALSLILAFAGCSNDDEDTSANNSSEVENSSSSDKEDSSEENSSEDSSDEDEVKVMSYDEYIAAELDAEVVVETYVQAKQGWWFNDKVGHGVITLYTQDQDGAYFVYEMACEEEDAAKLEVGTKIRVKGYKAEWSGEVEITDGTFEFVEDGDTYVAEALDVTELLAAEDLIAHQNEFVSFKGMTVVASKDAEGNEAAFLYGWDGSGQEGSDSDLYFNVSVGDQTYTFTVEYYLCGADTDVYKAVQALEIGDVIDMEGFLYWYEGVNPHITSVTAAAE